MRIRSAIAPLAVAAALSGCGPAAEPPGPDVPAGWSLAGRTEALRPFLARLARLEGTPLGDEAGRALERIAPCDQVTAHCPPGEACSILDQITCRTPRRPGGVDDPAESSWWVGWRALDGRWAVAEASGAADRPTVEVTLMWSAEGPEAMLLPGRAPSGPPVANSEGVVVHLRVATDSGLESLLAGEGDGWSERLFALQTDLVLSRALTGVWELVAYEPRDGEPMPPMALALDVKDRELAVRAMDEFLSRLMKTWPIRASTRELDGASVTCLAELRLLPGLAPCYRATDRAIFIGWNAESLSRALAEGAPTNGFGDESGGWARLDLGAMQRADQQLRAATGATGTTGPYPWDGIVAKGWRDGDLIRAVIEFEGGEP